MNDDVTDRLLNHLAGTKTVIMTGRQVARVSKSAAQQPEESREWVGDSVQVEINQVQVRQDGRGARPFLS